MSFEFALLYYSYTWINEDGIPYYVGKGHGDRALAEHSQGRRIIPYPKFSNIIIQYYESEEQAFEAEKFLISYYGRKDLGTGTLWNLTDGGEGAWNKGMLGQHHSINTRLRISKTRIEKRIRHSNEVKLKMSRIKLGTKQTEEAKKKRSIALLKFNANKTEEQILEQSKRISIGMKNSSYIRSEETKLKISISVKNTFSTKSLEEKLEIEKKRKAGFLKAIEKRKQQRGAA